MLLEQHSHMWYHWFIHYVYMTRRDYWSEFHNAIMVYDGGCWSFFTGGGWCTCTHTPTLKLVRSQRALRFISKRQSVLDFAMSSYVYRFQVAYKHTYRAQIGSKLLFLCLRTLACFVPPIYNIVLYFRVFMLFYKCIFFITLSF